MSGARLRVAVLQMEAEAGAVAANLDRLEDGLDRAAKAGAALMVAPELAVTGYGAGDAMHRLSEPVDGPSAQRLAAAAQRTGVTLVTGFAERQAGAARNVALVLAPDGGRHVYAKRQLYSEYETSIFEAGSAVPPLFTVGGMSVSVLICFDAEFPEHMRALARRGAQLVAVPTALPLEGSCDFVAGNVIPVRAFENQIFVAYADHAGHDGRFRYAGGSCVAAPDGSELARTGRDPALLVADLDDAAYEESRKANPYLQEPIR